MTDHAQLRKIAAAATPWTFDGCAVVIPRDTAYIAAANPQAAIALLDEIDRLRAFVREFDRYMEQQDLYPDDLAQARAATE